MLLNPFQTFFNYTQKKFIIPLFLSCSFFFAGCAMITIQIGGKISPYEEKTISGKGEDKILLIDISGVITSKSRSDVTGIKKEPGMVERVKEQLNKAGKDKKIRAIILRVNTPGGTVTASDIIYHELLECKKKKDVKIDAGASRLAGSIIADKDMGPLFWLGLFLADNLHCIFLPFVDQVRAGCSSLKPQVKTPEGIAFIHFAEDGSTGIGCIRFNPASVTKGFIPFRRLDSFDVNKAISFHAESTAKFPAYSAPCTLPFYLILIV